jgi:hypothetical protein
VLPKAQPAAGFQAVKRHQKGHFISQLKALLRMLLCVAERRIPHHSVCGRIQLKDVTAEGASMLHSPACGICVIGCDLQSFDVAHCSQERTTTSMRLQHRADPMPGQQPNQELSQLIRCVVAL